MSSVLESALRTALASATDIYASIFAIQQQHGAEAVSEALAALNGNGIDLFGEIASATDANLRRVQFALLPAVGHLASFGESNATTLLDYSGRFPMASHFVAEQLALQFAKHPALAMRLTPTMLAEEGQNRVRTRVWAGAFSKALPQQAAVETQRLAGADDASILLAAHLVQFLDFSSPPVQTALQGAHDDLASAVHGIRQAAGASETVWQSLAILASHSTIATRCVLDAITTESAEVVNAVVNSVNASPTSASFGTPPLPFIDVGRAFTLRSMRDAATRQTVDQLISQRLYRNVSKPDAVACIDVLRTFEGNLSEEYPAAVEALTQDPVNFPRVVTTWLLQSGGSFAALKSLVRQCTMGLPLDPVVLGAATDADRLRMVRRILALLYLGPVICGIAGQLAENPTLQPFGLDLASAILETAFVEFPAATEAFLRERTRPAARHQPWAPAYRHVYALALRWRRRLDQLPKIKELNPTQSQTFALRLVQGRQSRDVMREASRHSIFSRLVTSVHIKQGNRAATRLPNGAAPQIMEMQRMSHSLELPASEASDPLGALIRRRRLLTDAQ